MKKYKYLTGVMAAAVLSGANAMAAFNYQNGDLLAAFGTGGATPDVIVDLGAISAFQPGLNGTYTFDLSAVLTANFGSVNNSIYWSVFGVNDTTIGNNSSVTQADPNTIWNTLKRSNPGVQTTAPFVAGSSALQANALGDIQTIGNLTVPALAAPGLITDYSTGVELVDTSLGGYTGLMTGAYSGNFQGDWTYNILNNGAGTSDLYQSDPGNHLTQRATYLGNFQLAPSGILTFNPSPVPEPTTWAMLGSGALALLALRRRK